MDVSSHTQSNDIWSTAYLIDSIFNDLMDKFIEDKNGNKMNKYICHAIIKLQDFRINSPVTFFEIIIDDLSTVTRQQLNDYVKNRNSESKMHHKLNGIMTEVISLIYKQAESLILSSIEYEDSVWVKKTINEIRERIKNKWKLS